MSDNFDNEYALVREALVREIRDATRWMAVVEAWSALNQVRLMAGHMQAEREHLRPSGTVSQQEPGP